MDIDVRTYANTLNYNELQSALSHASKVLKSHIEKDKFEIHLNKDYDTIKKEFEKTTAKIPTKNITLGGVPVFESSILPKTVFQEGVEYECLGVITYGGKFQKILLGKEIK